MNELPLNINVLVSPERPGYNREYYGLKARLAIATKNSLDPSKKVSPIAEKDFVITPEKKAAVTKAIEEASIYDRTTYWENEARLHPEVAGAKEQWEKSENDFYTAVLDPDNQQIVSSLSLIPIADVDWQVLTNANSTPVQKKVEWDKIIHRYFSEPPRQVTINGVSGLHIPSNINQFLEDIRPHYSNTDGSFDFARFRQDGDAVQFFAALFGGSATDELVTHWIETIEISQNPTERQHAVQKANENINGAARADRPNMAEKEDFDVEFLHQHGNIQVNLKDSYVIDDSVLGAPPAGGRNKDVDADPDKVQPLEADRPHDLVEVFQSVPHSPERGSEYFVQSPQATIDITDDVVRDLTQDAVKRSFVESIADDGNSLKNNIKVIPHAFEFGNNDSYRALERLTDDDSGFLSLCGISAETPEQQGALYIQLSLFMVKALQQNPDLLETWVDTQQKSEFTVHPKNQELRVSSYNVLILNDCVKDANGQPKTDTLRPTNEVLLAFRNEDFLPVWTRRMVDLEQKLQTGKLTLAEMRQIEFLSHCFDTKKLFKLAQRETAKPTNNAESIQNKLKKVEGLRDKTKGHKKRDEITSEIDYEFGRLQSKQVLGDYLKQISASIETLLIDDDPKMPPESRKKIHELILQKLDSGGVPITDRNNMAEIIPKYRSVRNQEADALPYTYDQFKEDFSAITLSRTTGQVNQGEVIQFRDCNSRFETFSDKDQNISLIHLPNGFGKDEDSIGIEVNPDGTISAVIADGVSGGIMPRFASRIAALEGLALLENEDPTLDTLKKVHDTIQEYDVAGLAWRYILEQKRALAIATDDAAKQNFQDNINNFMAYLQPANNQNWLSATTFAGIKYDKSAGELKYALRSDSSLTVFRSDGSTETYHNAKGAPQLAYIRSSKDTYIPSPNAQTSGSIKLNEGDVAMMYCDAYDDYHKDLVENVRKKLSENPKAGRKDKLVTEFIQEEIKRDGGLGDDISTVVIEHTAITQSTLDVLPDLEAQESLLRILPPNQDGKAILLPTVEGNFSLAQKFMGHLRQLNEQALRDPSSPRRIKETLAQRQNSLGIWFNEVDGYYDILSFLEVMRDRFYFPAAIFNKGQHANLLLKIFEDQTDNKWKIVTYDPLSMSENVPVEEREKERSYDSWSPIKILTVDDSIIQGINIKTSPTLPTHEIATKIIEKVTEVEEEEAKREKRFPYHFYFTPETPDSVINSGSIIDYIHGGYYDLTLANDNGLTSATINAKTGKFQLQSNDCVAASIYAAMLRTTAKYAPDDVPFIYKRFLDEGLTEFQKTFGFTFATRDQLLPTT